MKKTFLYLALLFPFFATAQSRYTITGNLPGMKEPAKVYLALVKEGAFKNVDSAVVQGGRFHFSGHVDAPQQAIINLVRSGKTGTRQRRDHLGFFIENADIRVTGGDSIKNAQVSGSLSDQQNRELEKAIAPLTAKITAIYATAESLNEQEKKAARDSVSTWVAAIKQARVNFVKNHLDSYMGLYTFNLHVLDSNFDPNVVEPTFHRFSPALKASDLGKKSFQKIERAKRRQTGIIATDFTQNDLQGKPFQLSSLRGKYVLIDFWASWCAPCRAENPNLVKAYEALKDQNFEIVGVSLDQSKAAWENAVKTDQLPWIHISDLKGWKNEVAVLYDIRSVPQNFLVNPEGEIIAKNLRGEDLTEQLSVLIK